MARFGKGESGNPGGRPKADHDVIALARENSVRAVGRLAQWMESENARASVAACQAILDRAYGKPTQPISGDDEKPGIKIETPSVDALAKLSPKDRADIRHILGRALGKPKGDSKGA